MDTVYAIVDYEDGYVQPLLLKAIRARLPPALLIFINDQSELPSHNSRLLQWRQYESIDFDHLMACPRSSLANSNVIRKALIRKHYLSTTISHWITKHPDSVLKKHVKPTVEFEVDYAEFLDDALVEAWELKASWDRNLAKSESDDKEFWILKPGMSDRGQGIRLFCSEEDLQTIFEEWDPPDSDDEKDEDALAETDDDEGHGSPEVDGDGIITSQLRHFIAQEYIDRPLLPPPPHPSAGRKFHIRTYVVSVGALKVYVYKPMLALFAAQLYAQPNRNAESENENLGSHLTNTCLQSGEREGSVHAFWSLPQQTSTLTADLDWKQDVFEQICNVTGELFKAAALSMGIHFQPLPNAFELFGVDFLVDAQGTVWLLEVNAFPDFKQTGNELSEIVQGLFEGVVDVAVGQFFQLDTGDQKDRMIKVLDVDLGRGG